jgi:peptide/nickel transport system permease protein
MQVSLLIGGTLLIEKVFGMPGIGSLMVNAIGARDLPMIQALALVYAVVVQGVNALTDAFEVLFNPRLRIE